MRALVLAVGVLVTIGCNSGGTSSSTPAPGYTAAYQLVTHCGIYYARFEGAWFYADPPNPRGQWNNPVDVGTMRVIDQNTIVFTDTSGNRAVFTKHPPYPTPAIQGCD